MSDATAAPPTEVVANGTRALELDISKLHSLPSEQQDLYLLNFVSELRQHVEGLTRESLPAHQASIKKEVVQIVGLAAPMPGRVIRQSLGSILADLFTRGTRSLLYDTINDLLAVVNAGKTERDLGSKHAAVVSLGRVFEAAGDSAVSLSGVAIASLLRLLKAAQSDTGLRGSIYRALALTVQGLGSSIDESVARDIWKQSRSAISNDKSTFVQKHSCNCLTALSHETTYFNNSSDFENAKTSIFKAIESQVSAVRHAAADALAAALLNAYTVGGTVEHIPVVRKPKKATKRQDDPDGEGELDRSSSPAPVKSSVKLNLGLSECLKVLSHQYCKASTSNRGRAGIVVCYKLFLYQLPEKVVEEHYGVVADHVLNELMNHPVFYHNRHRALLTRRYCRFILEEVVGSTLLGEGSQISAARWLINDVLKNYPRVVHEQREPPKRTLTLALCTLSSLITNLGPAITIMQDSCREALFQVLQHPSYTVQVHVGQCLRNFVLACPQQMIRSIDLCAKKLEQEIGQSGEVRQSHRRCTGYANAIAAMISTSRFHPLHGSLETFSRTLAYAIDLLKASAASELRVSGTQVQVAWILIGGLMSLGTGFVKVHLNQLLLLWRNALPKPLPGESAGKRGSLELSFLTHVRECALGAMLVFLRHNGHLVTLDSAKRLAVMLQNTFQFLETIPRSRDVEDIGSRLVPALQLQDLATMLRRRLLQCMRSLVSMRHSDQPDAASPSGLVGMAMQVFTEPESGAPKSLETSIAASASNFEKLWDVEDNWAFGVTGYVQNSGVHAPDLVFDESSQQPSFGTASEDHVDHALSNPVCTALEHDSVLLYCQPPNSEEPAFNPPATAVINEAISLFAISLPLQPPMVQSSVLEQLATIVVKPFQREPGKKAAVIANVSTALLCTLRVASGETAFSNGKLNTSSVEKIINEMLRRSVADNDSIIRSIGAQALGYLCQIAGSPFTNSEVKYLVESIVSNRDPHVRAGCATALGCIHMRVGGMAASLHLKSIVGVLLSLCNDTHPIVHHWALIGLSDVADSAGLTFSPYVASALGMLAQLYISDSHTDESPSLATSNLEMEFATPVLVGKCVDALINVLGPDLQDVAKARALILTLVNYFQHEDVSALRVQAFTCLGHVSMYAPAHVHFSKYISDLQHGMLSTDVTLREVAIDGLNTMMKRNANEVARVASSRLAEDIWLKLDHIPYSRGLHDMLRTWMQQSYLLETAEWLQQCQNILSKARSRPDPKAQALTAKSTTMPDLADEEVAGFAAAVAQVDGAEPAAEGQELLRWQTREFAMFLLSEMIGMIAEAILPDQTIPAEVVLQNKVADIVRMAFTASTANVINLRILGLRILDQVLQLFGKTPDPDFLEASLLEQYQAQISSALTPAFAADSSPELAAEAFRVCASFAATGIVTTVDRMGRIFKILVSGLDDLVSAPPDTAIGDLQGFSSHARVMLKMAGLAAWAQLLLASNDQPYLEPIVSPFVSRLAPLWLSALQEFAALRFEPEISSSLGGDAFGNNIDERYSAFNREIRLRYYEENWLSLVNAIAVLVDKDSNAVFDALDKKQEPSATDSVSGDRVAGKDMSFREEPVAFFFILYGLAFEALVTQAREDPSQSLAILQALQKILRPAVSGNAIYEDVVFNETTDTLDRLALTSSLETQAVLVEISKNLSLDHLSAKDDADRDEKLSDDIDQLFELTRIIILVLTGLVPTLEDPPVRAARTLNDVGTGLVQTAFQALVDVAEVFPSVIRADLHACILHCYCTLLATGICQAEVVPQAVPIFRSFLHQTMRLAGEQNSTTRLVRGCLARMLTILTHAQRRENEYALACAKNTLLSITVLLTSSSRAILPHDELVTKALSELLDCLHDVGLAKVATNCLRSLLLVTPKTECDEALARVLFPKLLEFVSDPEAEDPENVKNIVVQALVSSVQAFAAGGRRAAMSILIPLLLMRVEQATANGSTEKLRVETTSRLLELASQDPLAFRSTVQMLDEEQRSSLESMLRSAGGQPRSHRETLDPDDSKPTIELRMDF